MHQANYNSSIALGEGATEPETSEKLVLDLEHLNHYTLGDQSLANEILQLFIVQVDVYLDGLQSARDGIDWQQVAHGLKGSARAIGANSLAGLAEKAEHCALADVNHTRQEFLPGLCDEVYKAKSHIKTLLAKYKAA